MKFYLLEPRTQEMGIPPLDDMNQDEESDGNKNLDSIEITDDDLLF